MNIFLQTQTQDILLQSDKIYSVLTVILLIFAGFIVTMIMNERKLHKIEKIVQDKKTQKK